MPFSEEQDVFDLAETEVTLNRFIKEEATFDAKKWKSVNRWPKKEQKTWQLFNSFEKIYLGYCGGPTMMLSVMQITACFQFSITVKFCF